MLSVVMLNVVMLSVIMLSVLAPFGNSGSHEEVKHRGWGNRIKVDW
jgi:hypothetical protein